MRQRVLCLVVCLTLAGLCSQICAAPVVTNNCGASNVTDSSAVLHGEMLDLGGAGPAKVSIYWGQTDGGTNPVAWSNSVYVGMCDLRLFSTDVSGLAPNTTYYYRCWASNSSGVGWAPSSASFRTYESGRASAPAIWRHGYDAVFPDCDLLYVEVQVESLKKGFYCAIQSTEVVRGNGCYFGLQRQLYPQYSSHVHFATFDSANGASKLAWKVDDAIAQRHPEYNGGWTIAWPFDISDGATYALCVALTHKQTSTIYRAYFQDLTMAGWKHLATVELPVPDGRFENFASFLEDAAATPWLYRSYLIGNEWAHKRNGEWVDLSTALFLVGMGWANEEAYDADVTNSWFRLETGDGTVRDTPPGAILVREAGRQPTNLPDYTLNHNPTAQDLSDSVLQNGAYFGSLRASDEDGDDLTFVVVSAPQNGWIEDAKQDGTFTYRPFVNYIGNDEFAFAVSDGRGGSDTGFVRLTVAPYPPAVAAVEKSGATDSYRVGDDGYHQAGVNWASPRFTDIGDGTIRDNNTGLIWLKNANPCGTKNWNDAIDFCNSLANGMAGLTDWSVAGTWRLPNQKEICSLFDYGTSPLLPSGHPFINVVSGWYWLSNTMSGEGCALGVSLTDGIHITWGKAVNYWHVWSVKGNSTGWYPAPVEKSGATHSYRIGDDGYHQAGVNWASPRFTDNRNGTIRDNNTGLIWLKDADPCGVTNWIAAIDYANSLCSGKGGLTDGSLPGDWRLPNIKELYSLFDYGHQPLLPSDHPFDDVPSGGYWISTTPPTDANAAYLVALYDCNTYLRVKVSNDGKVWPVRSVRSVCGDPEHPYPAGDLDHDCEVTFADFALFAGNWLKCTKPECD